MQADIPKTINEALKILAYNDYFWSNGPKTPNATISPHPKDFKTCQSLADSQYTWTEKQAKLAVVILKRYLTKFQAYNMDIKSLLDNPKFDAPFRVLNYQKSIEKFTDTDEVEKIEIRFPYDKKVIGLIRILKDMKGLPAGCSHYDGDQKKWIFLHSDVTAYYLTMIAIRYNFKFVDETLLDDFETIRREKKYYRHAIATLEDNKIKLHHASESLVGLDELNCWPIIMPVSGDIQTREDALEWIEWLQCFERHGISATKNLSFGFDISEPARHMLPEDDFQDWFDISQLSKQFKYIDKDTKVIFARNRIPRSLIKSKIKPKASLTALGGGYYTSGTENLKRLLDNLPKKLYTSSKIRKVGRQNSFLWTWWHNIFVSS